MRYGVAVDPTYSSTTSNVDLFISMLVVTSTLGHGVSRMHCALVFHLDFPINWDHHPVVL
jgi:hypothetical protein